MSRTTTERRPRLPKSVVRAWAWVTGGITFFGSWILLGMQPKPAGEGAQAPPPRPVSPQPVTQVILLRRVVIEEIPVAAAPAVRYVSGGGSGAVSSGGGAPVPAPPPVASSGGS
jgi:hypothetical protein